MSEVSKRLSQVATGLAELSGIHLCEGGCGRTLKAGHGKRVKLAAREVRTCFSPPCLAWAERQQAMEALS